jgi:hypothetical protein
MTTRRNPKGRQPSLVDRLWVAQNGCCFHCGRPMLFGQSQHPARWSREHLYPQSRRGEGTNKIVLAHRSCNSARGNPEPTDDELDCADALYAAIGEHGYRPFPKSAPLPLGNIADLWPGRGTRMTRLLASSPPERASTAPANIQPNDDRRAGRWSSPFQNQR